MQPIQASFASSSLISISAAEDEKKRKADESLSVETSHVPNPAVAQDAQKMFASMATSGGIARVPVSLVPVQTDALSAEKREQIMQLVQAEVTAILKNPKVEAAIERGQQDAKGLEAVKKNIAFTESYYTSDEKVVCAYLTDMGRQALKPLLPMCQNQLLAKAPDEIIEVAIKYGLQHRLQATELDGVQKACAKLKDCYKSDLTELIAQLRTRPLQTTQTAPSLEGAVVGHEMALLKATVQDPGLLLSLLFLQQHPEELVVMKALITQFEAQATTEELVFFTHMATAIQAEYTPLLALLAAQNPLLKDCFDDVILTAIKKTLYPKVKEATAELIALAPEHVAKMVKVRVYQPYILQLGLLVKKLEALPSDERSQLREAAKASDKEVLPTFLAANSENAILKEINLFLQSVPEAIYASIVKAFAE